MEHYLRPGWELHHNLLIGFAVSFDRFDRFDRFGRFDVLSFRVGQNGARRRTAAGGVAHQLPMKDRHLRSATELVRSARD